MNRLVRLSRRLVEAHWFEYFIIGVIVANGILLGLETSTVLERNFGHWMHLGNNVCAGHLRR